MLPALATALLPVVINTVKETLKKKAPEEVKEILEHLDRDPEIAKEVEKELLNAINTYNEQLLRELEIREKYKNINRIAQLVRPTLTFAITGAFNITLLVGVFTGKITFEQYLTTLAPVNSMLLGFWFGERSALKDPRRTITED